VSARTQSVCAVVVTRNRRELLRECLAAVTGQTRPPDHVLVVDNAGSDGSAEAVAREHPDAELVRLERNEGGAGGFHEGMRRGAEQGWDWLWLMDDDTIPEPDALERLLETPGKLPHDAEQPALLASSVVWTDGRLHPMNQPRLDMSDLDAVLRGFEQGAVPMRLCTFPSLLVRGAAIARHGLPRKEFFIWSDDIDFTARVLRHESGYFVPASVAVHKTETAAAPWAGGERFYYAVRNGLWLVRGDALNPKERFVQLLVIAGQVQRFLSFEGYSLASLRILSRGLLDGLRRPRGAR
jgi:rhamnopyranosyl-N-acetylglucosaminyl-diphospho-decaprenol beta-1,3/1,4-galactofuranosyltransferase